MRSHDWIDERSLALHRAVAVKIARRPELLDLARANLARWLSTHRSRALLEWQDELEQRSLSHIVELLTSTSERATWLRQSSPFAGVLSPQEREAILRRHDPRRA